MAAVVTLHQRLTLAQDRKPKRSVFHGVNVEGQSAVGGVDAECIPLAGRMSCSLVVSNLVELRSEPASAAAQRMI